MTSAIQRQAGMGVRRDGLRTGGIFGVTLHEHNIGNFKKELVSHGFDIDDKPAPKEEFEASTRYLEARRKMSGSIVEVRVDWGCYTDQVSSRRNIIYNVKAHFRTDDKNTGINEVPALRRIFDDLRHIFKTRPNEPYLGLFEDQLGIDVRKIVAAAEELVEAIDRSHQIVQFEELSQIDRARVILQGLKIGTGWVNQTLGIETDLVRMVSFRESSLIKFLDGKADIIARIRQDERISEPMVHLSWGNVQVGSVVGLPPY